MNHRDGSCSCVWQVQGNGVLVQTGICDALKAERAAETEASKPDYRELRRRAYPLVGDQLDAIWNGGEAFSEMKKQIDAVKEMYPKPDA